MSSSASCSVCRNAFGRNEDVASTNCGHVFHSTCLDQSNRQFCPQCRSQNPRKFKLFLNFEDNEQEESELRQQLDHTIETSHELEEQLVQKEHELQLLRRKILENTSKISDLENQLQQSENNWLQLQEEFAKVNADLCERENEILVLKGENASRESEIKQINEEHEEICMQFGNALDTSSALNTGDIASGTRLKVLEEKLQQTTLELEKEIYQITQLNYENMILRKELEKYKTPQITEQATATARPSQLPEPPQKVGTTPTLSTAIMLKPAAAEKKEPTITEKGSINQAVLVDNKKDISVVSSIVIGNVSERIYETDHVVFIQKLSTLLGFECQTEDIEKTYIKKNSYQMRNKIKTKGSGLSLIVQLKSRSMVDSFVANREKLKQHEQAKEFTISEYVSDETNNLYHKAKILKSVGYGVIFSRNNSVFARKRDGVEIQIMDVNHVQQLINSERGSKSSGIDLFGIKK